MRMIYKAFYAALIVLSINPSSCYSAFVQGGSQTLLGGTLNVGAVDAVEQTVEGDTDTFGGGGGNVANGPSFAGGANGVSASEGGAVATLSGVGSAFATISGTLQATSNLQYNGQLSADADSQAFIGSTGGGNGVDQANATAIANGVTLVPGARTFALLYVGAEAEGAIAPDDFGATASATAGGSIVTAISDQGSTILIGLPPTARVNSNGTVAATIVDAGFGGATVRSDTQVGTSVPFVNNNSAQGVALAVSGAYAFTAPQIAQPAFGIAALTSTTPQFGDVNFDFTLNATDIDLVSAEILTGSGSVFASGDSAATYVPGASPLFDLNLDTDVSVLDRDWLVRDGLSTEYGDRNLDGVVDLLDLDGFTLGPGGWADGDFNGDAVVDLVDLDILGSNFGFGTSTAIPEPAGLLMLVVGAMATCTRRSV